MATSSRAEQHDEESVKRLLQAEAALLALILLRRKKAVESEIRRGRDPSGALAAAVRGAILIGRTAARRIGRERLGAQLGVELAADPRGLVIDTVRATQLGARHAAAVAQAAGRIEGGALWRWSQALDGLTGRAKVTAATETHSAASSERAAAASDASRIYLVSLMQVWRAEHDACAMCRLLDGTRVPPGEPFPGGLEPGLAHAFCRCWRGIVRVRRKSAAAA